MDSPIYSSLPPSADHLQGSGARLRRKILHPVTLALFGALSLLIFVLWPSDPNLRIVRLRVQHLKVHTRPRLSVDVAVAATVKVSNGDAYTVDFEATNMAVLYRGKELGHVTTAGGHVRFWGSTYVDAVAKFDDVDVFSDWVYMLDDLVRGTVSFDTVSTVNGRLGFFFFQLPFKSKTTCSIDVNIKTKAIARQTCYSE